MIAVTGIHTPTGKHLVDHLLKQGRQVRLLMHEGDPADLLVARGSVEVVHGDVLDVTALDELLLNATVCYHLDSRDSLYQRNKREMYRYNMTGTANVVNACLANNVGSLLYLSTIYAFGEKKEGDVWNESSKWANKKLAKGYGWSKHLAEREMWRGAAEGLRTFIVNPGIILSPLWSDDYSSEVMQLIVQGQSSALTGSAHFVDVRDLVHLMTSLTNSERNAEQYVVKGHVRKLMDMARQVEEAGGLSSDNLSDNGRPKEIKNWWQKGRRMLERKNPRLTKAAGKVLSDNREFTGERLFNDLEASFRPLRDSLKWCCGGNAAARSVKHS